MKSLNTKISLAGMASFLLVAASLLGFSSVMPTVTATTATATPPVTAATDNESVNVLISWEPTEIEPEQDTEFTIDFQDPSSGDSISHVNYNFEIIDENNGETVESMTDLHTHSGSDEQTVTFDTTGSFNFVVTVIGTGINPPFDTTQSGTAETIIAVGQEEEPSPVVPNGNDTTATTATTDDDDTTTTTTASPPEEAGMIELSPEPVYQERQGTVSETPINQTHIQLALSGSGTITLPNTTETISTTSTGSLIASLDGTAAGKEVITTEDGSESATATIYAIARFGMEEGRGIIIALVNTDSTTGRLAPLDGMILAGQIEFPPEEETALVTLWEWQSGIPLPTTATPPPSEELPPLMNDTTTTTTTNATTTTTDAADTNAATTAAPEEEVGAEGDEQQQQPQQTTPTIPPSPLLE
jgi:hypothetical protein